MEADLINNPNWWDSKNPNSFFNLYQEGDDSKEGFYPEREYNQAERTNIEVDFVEKLLKLNCSDIILDCPCGIGRHSIELAKRGHNVTGVDLCEKSIKKAVEKSQISLFQQKVSFYISDARHLPFEKESYSSIINMFFSFGFFATDQENFAVLNEFYRVLTKNGKLLIHTDINPNRIISNTFNDRRKRTIRDGSILLVDEAWDPISKRLNGTWKIISNSSIIKQAYYSVRIYSNSELQEMLKLAGFKEVSIFYKDAALIDMYNTNAREVIYIAKKR